MLLVTGRAETALESAEGMRIPLFDPATGERWGKLEIPGIHKTAPRLGPFQLGLFQRLSFDSLRFRFSYWPGDRAVNSQLGQLGQNSAFRSIAVSHVRIDCEQNWSLTLANANIRITPAYSHLSAAQGVLLTPLGAQSLKQISLRTQAINGALLINHENGKFLHLPLPEASR